MSWLRRLFGRSAPPGFEDLDEPAPAPAPPPPKATAPKVTAPRVTAPQPEEDPQVAQVYGVLMSDGVGDPVGLGDELALDLVEAVRVAALARPLPPNALPAIAMQVLEVVESPDLDVNALVRCITNDVGITAAVLNVAGSAAYAGMRRVQDVRDAVLLLGAHQVATIAASIAMRSLYDPRTRLEHEEFAAIGRGFYAGAVGNALTASWLVQHARLHGAESAFLAGLLREIGRPSTLRALAGLVVDGILPHPGEALVHQLLDELADHVGHELLRALKLPPQLSGVCTSAPVDAEAVVQVARLVAGVGQLVAGVGAPSRWRNDVHLAAEELGLDAATLRAVVKQRLADAERAAVLCA